MSDVWKPNEHLSTFVDALNGLNGSLRIIRRNVLENVFEPALSLCGPRYCCHARMRRLISSFEIVRFASESESPRSTIT